MEEKKQVERDKICKMFEDMYITKNPKVPEVDSDKLYADFLEQVLKCWKYNNINNRPSYLKDEWKPDYTNAKTGGIDLKSSEVTSIIRSTGWELIKQIGKKIISGDFNLTSVSMPIKVMVPVTILQGVANSMFTYPYYFGLASLSKDPLERFKFIVVASLTPFHRSSYFLKPMNPILGETFEMSWEDGSKVYMEQTSHHPPVSHYLMYGPNNSYRYHGFSNFSSSAGLNSLKVVNKGHRFVEFPDGTKITYDFCAEAYSNSFWGTLRQESTGEVHYKDLTHGFECTVQFGSVKKKTSDFFQTEIKVEGKVVSKIYGSYLAYVEFDGVRYWDIRECPYLKALDITDQPPSSSLFREDRILLEQGKVEEGQVEKEKLEAVQRADRKLRENFKKSIKK